MSVADNLKRMRKAKNLTQAQLAKISSVSQQAISFIESSRNTPTEGTVRLLAKALNCNVSELLDEPEPKEKQFTPSMQYLLSIVQRLNSLGVQKVIEYANDLAANDKYTQEASASSAV